MQRSNGQAAVSEETTDPRRDAARKRLRECKSRAETFEAIREIVSNLVGCEEMALFGLDRKRRQFSLLWSFGIEDGTFHLPKMFAEMAPCVIAGNVYTDHGFSDREMGGQGQRATAFVPILFKGEAKGLLALLRLLPQKTKIDELDRRLFAVLTEEAGRSLFGGKTGRPGKREGER